MNLMTKWAPFLLILLLFSAACDVGGGGPDSAPKEVELSVLILPTDKGYVEIDGSRFTPGTAIRVERGKVLNLVAVPTDEGWQFARWERDLTSTAPADALVMDNSKVVRAVFVPVDPLAAVLEPTPAPPDTPVPPTPTPVTIPVSPAPSPAPAPASEPIVAPAPTPTPDAASESPAPSPEPTHAPGETEVPPPVASFSVDVSGGSAPLTVQFSDTSQGSITSWQWDFGDGSSSTERNPSHEYIVAGSHTVRLTVSGPGSTDTAVLPDPITVSPGPPPTQFARVTEAIRVLGDPNSVVIDPQGAFAYLFTGSSLLVLDLGTRQLVQRHPTGNYRSLDDVDQSGNLLALQDHDKAAIFDFRDGSEDTLITGSAIRGATIANGFLYATSYNDRVVYVRPLDKSSGQTSINPYPAGGPVATPGGIARSPDESLVAFGDHDNHALHVISTVDNTVTTIELGLNPGAIAFLDNARVVVANAVFAHETPTGLVMIVDVRNPLAVPTVFEVETLTEGRLSGQALAIAVVSGTKLFIVHRRQTGVTSDGDSASQPEVVIVDLASQRVIGEVLLDDQPEVLPRLDIASTPDGRSVLVVGTRTIHFLE